MDTLRYPMPVAISGYRFYSTEIRIVLWDKLSSHRNKTNLAQNLSNAGEIVKCSLFFGKFVEKFENVFRITMEMESKSGVKLIQTRD